MKYFVKKKLFSVSLIFAFVCLAVLPLSANDLYKDSKSIIKGDVTVNGKSISVDAVTEEKYDKESGRFLLFGRENKPRRYKYIFEPGWYHVTGLIGEIIFLKKIGDRGVAKTTFGKYGTLTDEFVLTSVEPLVIEHYFSGNLENVPQVKNHADKFGMEFTWFSNGKAFGTATYQAETLEGETATVPVTYDIDTQTAQLMEFDAVINETGTNILGQYGGWARINEFNSETGEYYGESKYEVFPDGITPVADGHGMITKKIPWFHTMGHGVDDHFILLGRLDSVEVSALQWVDWKTDEYAEFLTVIGPEPKPFMPELEVGIMEMNENPVVYTAVRGFQPGDIEKTGEQILNLGGEIYSTSAKLLTKKELEANFPGHDFSRLTPTHDRELYCVALWDKVNYTNGKRINAGWWHVRPKGFPASITTLPKVKLQLPADANPKVGWLSKMIRRMLFEMLIGKTLKDPSDYEFFRFKQGWEIRCLHHYLKDGGGRGNVIIVSITGRIINADQHDRWDILSGISPEHMEVLRDSIVVDKVGKVITSSTRFMTKAAIQEQFKGIDVEYLQEKTSSGKLAEFPVDVFVNVQATTTIQDRL